MSTCYQGLIEKVTELVFPNPETRPSYLASVITHGLYSEGPFSTVYAGLGTISIGPVLPNQLAKPSNGKERRTRILESQYLLEEIIKTPSLVAKSVSPDDLVQAQIEKLIINAIINPLSVVLNRKNGQLFQSPAITHLMQLLLSEASLVVRSLLELEGISDIVSRFSVQNLERLVKSVAEKTADNTSSMLQDVIAGKETEIDYINGYIVERGMQLHIDCPHNRRITQMVKEKTFISEAQLNQFFPQCTSV